MQCLEPALTVVPDGDWLCPSSGLRQLKAQDSTQGQQRHLQQQQQQQQQQQEVASVDGGSLQQEELFMEVNEHAWLLCCLALQHAARSSTKAVGQARWASNGVHSSSQTAAALAHAAAAGAAAARAEDLQVCEGVSWHTARFMLPEYAEHVGRDGSGRAVKASDAVLPALWLNSVPRAFAGDGCCSLMDALQQRALPAAVQWVNEHLGQLPYLQQ
ncbi:hypothetical protein COO60DRAFT_555509 [Scenedesmus sp. NREL 46B-D3]|nr:hypothetical protein COO60DRAFT_555509 [Scenedesmus sp. NREL 46B-D3]